MTRVFSRVSPAAFLTRWTFGALLGLLAGMAGTGHGVAIAHIKVLAPEERPGRDARGDEQKAPPCGIENEPRSEAVSTFAPGDTFELRIAETIRHSGYFRVALDIDGDDDLAHPPEADWQMYKDFADGKRDRDSLPDADFVPRKDGNMWILGNHLGAHTRSEMGPDTEADYCPGNAKGGVGLSRFRYPRTLIATIVRSR